MIDDRNFEMALEAAPGLRDQLIALQSDNSRLRRETSEAWMLATTAKAEACCLRAALQRLGRTAERPSRCVHGH